MGLFDKIFKNNEGERSGEKEALPWIEMNSPEDLAKAINESQQETVAIFKHSTRCGVSRMVLKMFESDLKKLDFENTKFYFLDLIAHREVSNEIADKLNVRHESPQLIVLRNNEVVHHSSHQSISAGKIKEV